MRKTNLIKIIALLSIVLLVGMFSTSVYAESEGEDIYDSLEGSMDNSAESTKPEEKPVEKPEEKPEEKPASTDKNKENTSIYNNETKKDTTNVNKDNLPKTGLEDNLPMIALILVAGVTAVCTYKKVKEYSNI